MINITYDNGVHIELDRVPDNPTRDIVVAGFLNATDLGNLFSTPRLRAIAVGLGYTVSAGVTKLKLVAIVFEHFNKGR